VIAAGGQLLGQLLEEGLDRGLDERKTVELPFL
jgi:hypothetical protein